MVDQNGAQTLFQLVEVGVGPDASRLVKDLHLPAVLIDVALPAKHFGAMSAPRSLDRTGSGRQNRYEWPHWLVEAMKLPKDQEEMILRGNAAKLFRLPATT
ncbi:MAG: hypothetical protein DMF92_21280 [Acidobacteria bacterium]|nr:MAG: hypothetical protein DMF92_21280 [Acidobacteriota bacterium]